MDNVVVAYSESLCGGALDGVDETQDSVSCFSGDVTETHPHSRTKCILIGFRAHPGYHSLCRQPFSRTFGQGKLHEEFGADGQWSEALDK